MEITQETIDKAASEESNNLNNAMLQAQVQYMNDRIVVLSAYAKSLEKLCEENGIDYSVQQEEAKNDKVTPIKKTSSSKRPAKRAASKKK